MKDTKIVAEPFSWNDNLSELAMEDFNMVTNRLSYCTSQSIGVALAKLKIIEKLIKDKKIEIDLDKGINDD